MSRIYEAVGFLVFWGACAVAAIVALLTAIGLYRDRERIRWPWQSRTDGVPEFDRSLGEPLKASGNTKPADGLPGMSNDQQEKR